MNNLRCYGICGKNFFCIQSHNDGEYFSLYTVDVLPEDFSPAGIEAFLIAHEADGSSVAGTHEQVYEELHDFCNAVHSCSPDAPHIMSREEMIQSGKSEWIITDDDCCQIRRTDELTMSNIFEMYQITSYPGKHCTPPRAEYYVIQHAFIDVLATDSEEIADVLAVYGYKDLDDFVEQTSPGDPYAEAVYDANGDIDRLNSPNYVIDWGLIAEMLFEQECQTTECNLPIEYDTWSDAVKALASMSGCNELLMCADKDTFPVEGGCFDFVLKKAGSDEYVASFLRHFNTNETDFFFTKDVHDAAAYPARILHNWLSQGIAERAGDNYIICSGEKLLVESVYPSYKGTLLKVEWVNLNEGYNGDYDPSDPEDENLLRFDVLEKHENGWEVMESGSYCTMMPANTSAMVLHEAARYIYERLTTGTADGESVRHILESCTHISPAAICPPADDKLTEAELAKRGYRSQNGDMLPVCANTAEAFVRYGPCRVYAITPDGAYQRIFCADVIPILNARNAMFAIDKEEWCHHNRKQALAHGLSHYLSAQREEVSE